MSMSVVVGVDAGRCGAPALAKVITSPSNTYRRDNSTTSPHCISMVEGVRVHPMNPLTAHDSYFAIEVTAVTTQTARPNASRHIGAQKGGPVCTVSTRNHLPLCFAAASNNGPATSNRDPQLLSTVWKSLPRHARPHACRVYHPRSCASFSSRHCFS